MNICLFTNTFLPHVGGVARSVQTLLEDLRRMRHSVLVVAPEFSDGRTPRRIERSVERVAAIQHFNGSDFSVRLPLATGLSERLAKFRTDVIHAHHPFLLGDSALRIAVQRAAPIVFTHHTLYENYTHYVPFDSQKLKDFVIELSTLFANRCDGVIAPSQSIEQLIVARGVTVPVRVVPTGIDTNAFAKGSRVAGRRNAGIKRDALVIGHVGRLAPEKNLEYLASAVAKCLRREPRAHFLVVGEGPSQKEMVRIFSSAKVDSRVHFAGKLTGRALHDAYAAMDVFAFASKTETQGMVLAEAMAARKPVVALDASGVREIVRDGANGRLLSAGAPPETMARALLRTVRDPLSRARFAADARKTAAEFDHKVTSSRTLEFYRELVNARVACAPAPQSDGRWNQFLDRLAVEGALLADKVGAAVRAIRSKTARTPEIAAR